MTSPIDRRLVVLAAACVVVTAGCLAVYAVTERRLFVSFVWNLFLAVLPLVASIVVDVHGRARPWVGWVACAVWLPLFPNAVYVTTDIIHLRRVWFGGDDAWPFDLYTSDMVAWSQLFVIASLVVLTLYLGLWSLSQVHTFLTARWGSVRALGAVVGVALACGYGIYLGRFVRLNSWEVLQPDTLLPTLVRSANGSAVTFTGLVTGYVLLTYALFWAFADRTPVRLWAPTPHGRTAPDSQPARSSEGGVVVLTRLDDSDAASGPHASAIESPGLSGDCAECLHGRRLGSPASQREG